MIKFIRNSFLFVSLVSLSFALIITFLRPLIRDTNAFVGASIDKEKRLTDLKGPKIIFLGGSNVGFGLDSRMVEDSTHYPVVNMALQAPLGLKFMIDEVTGNIKRGDIIILSSEYFLKGSPDLKILSQLCDLNPNESTYVHLNFNEQVGYFVADLQRCLIGLIKTLSDKGSYRQNGFFRDGFNKEGDFIAHLDRPREHFAGTILKKIGYSDELEHMNALVTLCRQRGARIYYLYPTYQKTSFEVNKKAITEFSFILHKGLTCPILNKPESLVFPDSVFFNTEYHLTGLGRGMRTRATLKTFRENHVTKICP